MRSLLCCPVEKWREKPKPIFTSCLLLPFVAIWRLIVFIFYLLGRFVAVSLGLILILVGVVVSLTGIGAIVGIPMVLFGMVLIARGFF
jgi:hypothetical protein